MEDLTKDIVKRIHEDLEKALSFRYIGETLNQESKSAIEEWIEDELTKVFGQGNWELISENTDGSVGLGILKYKINYYGDKYSKGLIVGDWENFVAERDDWVWHPED